MIFITCKIRLEQEESMETRGGETMKRFLNTLIKSEVDRRVKFLNVHLHLVLEVSQKKRAHPGTFLQWNGGRSTVNGGHLLAFNVVRLHRGPAIVRRRTKTVPDHDPTKTRTRPT